MESALANVSTAAVWTGMATWMLLGSFMVVQAVMDPALRFRYAAFSAVVFFRVALDFSHPYLLPATYELLRLAWVGAFAGATLRLLGHSRRSSGAVAGAVFAAGAVAWAWIDNAVATSVAFPLGFGAAAAAFALRYRERPTFAPAVLCAYFTAIAFACATYYWTIRAGIPRAVVLGYAHMAVINALAVLFGWSHLPRDLSGRVPVRAGARLFGLHFAGVFAGEVAVVAALTVAYGWPPVLFVSGLALATLATMLFFFHHRHQLAIHTDDVAALLDRRTASLLDAREELARLNREQALQLERQARDLETKAAVIERQRRLELAAQTTGQYAHDLQHLLTPALEQVEKLQWTVERDPAPRLAVDGLRHRLERVADLNGQMLALARRGRLDRHPVSLAELAHQTAGLIQAAEVIVRVERPVWVEGSWSQLSRALGNLVVNALEATPRRDDRVEVRVDSVEVAEGRPCHLGFLSAGRWAALSVTDHGPGIPPEIRDRIYEPFFSSKVGSSRSGSGLGLAIVAAAVGDHRGVVDLCTGAEGTSFIVYLPETAAPAVPDPVPVGEHSESILVVDDDPALRTRTLHILEQAGYHAQHAADARSAMEVLRSSRIDLVVLDLKLPGRDGCEALVNFRLHKPTLRAIVHSGYVSDHDAERLAALGVTAILAKPAGREEILAAVRKSLLTTPPPMPPGLRGLLDALRGDLPAHSAADHFPALRP